MSENKELAQDHRPTGDTNDVPTMLTAGSSSYPSQRLTAPSAIFPGEVLGDRYRVIERLGKGGMGEVHLAEHIAIGRRVAIKTLSGDFHERPELARRFLQEARTVSKVRHPNIVDITDFGHTERGAPFFAMELLEGEDLKALLRREKTLPWAHVCAIMAQICAALTAAHDRGIVHRDMKPDNVFLIQQGETELVKVLDFGIAKITHDEGVDATRTGVLLGTPHYMSPEQAQDDPLDDRSDIYSVGVLLFRMVTGRLPFRGKSVMKVLGMHMHQPPPCPREFAPEGSLSEAAEALILTCLAKLPGDRFGSAAELAAALRATNEPIRQTTAPNPATLADDDLLDAPRGRGIGTPIVAAILGISALLLAWTLTRPSAAPMTAAASADAAEHDVDPTTLTATPSTGMTTGASGDGDGETSASDGTMTAADRATETGEEDPPTVATTKTMKQTKKKTEKKTEKKTKKALTATKAAPKPALSAGDLSAAAASVRKALAACSGGLPGIVIKVDVTVSPEGKVRSAQAHKPQHGSALGNCVERAAKRARFPELVTAQKATLPLRLP